MAGAGLATDGPGAVDLNSRRLTHALHTGLQVDYVGGTNPIYVGWAEPGTPVSASLWRIAFLTWDANNNVLSVQWAQGTIAYVFQWTARTTYPYL